MSIEQDLRDRSENKCELCNGTDDLDLFKVPESVGDNASIYAFLCKTCREQIQDPEMADPNHWRCLNDSMWSQVPAVQVLAYRMLHTLKSEGWPSELLDMMYLEEDVKIWAEAGIEQELSVGAITHRDNNGVVLEAGDSVVLIKDLKVKGSSLIAKQGSAVRRISLDPENEKYIEGKVDGQTIVIITDYIKKI